MQQLERSLATLREMSAHVASNDTVSRLSAQVQTLAEKIDRLAVEPRSEVKLDNLASRIDALTRALAERTQVEIAAPQRFWKRSSGRCRKKSSSCKNPAPATSPPTISKIALSS